MDTVLIFYRETSFCRNNPATAAYACRMIKEMKEVEHENNEQELSELLQIRRDKLDELRGLGVDPFGRKFERTHNAKDIVQAL